MGSFKISKSLYLPAEGWNLYPTLTFSNLYISEIKKTGGFSHGY